MRRNYDNYARYSFNRLSTASHPQDSYCMHIKTTAVKFWSNKSVDNVSISSEY